MTKKKKDNLYSITGEIHPELVRLTDKISRTFKLNNGKTALYWHLITVISDHIQTDSIKRLDK